MSFSRAQHSASGESQTSNPSIRNVTLYQLRHCPICHLLKVFILEPWLEISNNVVCVTSNISDQPSHMPSLIRAFASPLNILWLLSYWPNIIWSLSVTSHINCIFAHCLINIVYLMACAFIRSWWHCTFWKMSLMTLKQQKNRKLRHFR